MIIEAYYVPRKFWIWSNMSDIFQEKKSIKEHLKIFFFLVFS